MHIRLLLLVMLLAAVTAPAQDSLYNPTSNIYTTHGPRSVIFGNLQDMVGNPLADVRIEVHEILTGRVISTAYTYGDGTFRFHDVPDGEYELVAYSGLYESRSRTVVPSGGPLSMRLLTNNTRSNLSTDGKHTVSVAQMKVPGKARKFFEKALSAFRKSHLDDAFSLVQKALGVYPNYAQALTLRGVMNLTRGDTQRAQPDLEKAVELDYSDATSIAALASLYNTEGKFDAAMRVLERGLSVQPNSWQALTEMARAQIGKRDYDSALKTLVLADRSAPAPNAVNHLLRARAFIGLNNIGAAVPEIHTYLQIEPNGINADIARKMLAQIQPAQDVPSGQTIAGEGRE